MLKSVKWTEKNIIRLFEGGMMEFKRVKKGFKVVGKKGSGAFVNFGTEVPVLAQ